MSSLIKNHRAFTLVELLAVVSIIALLCAILIPTGLRIRREALRTRCVGNLRQIGAACASYSADHDGKTVYSWYGEEGLPWPIVVAPYLGGIPNNKVWVCGAQPHITENNKWPSGWAGFTSSVDYGQQLINTNYKGGFPMRSIATTTPLSKIVYLIEGRNVFWDQASWDQCVAPYIGVHGAGVNALFFDYHVETIKNPNYPQVRDANF